MTNIIPSTNLRKVVGRRVHGMTLMEVLVALFIIAIGVVVLVSFHSEILQGVSLTHQHSEALALAEQKISQLQHFVALDTGSGTAYDDINNGTTTTTVNNTTYTVAWSVTTITDPPHKVISVTVSWTDLENVSRSVVLQTIVGRVDPGLSGQIMQDI